MCTYNFKFELLLITYIIYINLSFSTQPDFQTPTVEIPPIWVLKINRMLNDEPKEQKVN